jgi:hypothetical protein
MQNGNENLFPRFESFLLDESRGGPDCASDVLRSFESCSLAKEAVLRHRDRVLAKLTSSLRHLPGEAESADVGHHVQAVGATVRAILCLVREKGVEDGGTIATALGDIFLQDNIPADIMLNVVLCLLYDAKRHNKLEVIFREVTHFDRS